MLSCMGMRCVCWGALQWRPCICMGDGSCMDGDAVRPACCMTSCPLIPAATLCPGQILQVHLYYNLASLLYKGTLLEARLGSLRFAALVAELLLLSQGLYVVGAALLAAHIPEYR